MPVPVKNGTAFEDILDDLKKTKLKEVVDIDANEVIIEKVREQEAEKAKIQAELVGTIKWEQRYYMDQIINFLAQVIYRAEEGV